MFEVYGFCVHGSDRVVLIFGEMFGVVEVCIYCCTEWTFIDDNIGYGCGYIGFVDMYVGFVLNVE